MARKSQKGNQSQAVIPPGSSVAACTDSTSGSTPLDNVDSQTRLLNQITDQIAELHRMVEAQHRVRPRSDDEPSVGDDAQTLRLRLDEVVEHLRSSQQQNEVLRQQSDELQQQNEDLAAQLATSNVRNTVSSPQSSTSDALSWDDRKALILAQLEAETFDADAFVENLQSERDMQCESPIEFVDSLLRQLSGQKSELARKDEEIGELRCLLEQPCETRGSGVVVGAAVIAQLIDADELVLQERDRLQRLQSEWEDRFRRSEIDASLERAKLSRERQALANKTVELEEQIEHLRREARQNEKMGGEPTRRWLVKLGLHEEPTK